MERYIKDDTFTYDGFMTFAFENKSSDELDYCKPKVNCVPLLLITTILIDPGRYFSAWQPHHWLCRGCIIAVFHEHLHLWLNEKDKQGE